MNLKTLYLFCMLYPLAEFRSNKTLNFMNNNANVTIWMPQAMHKQLSGTPRAGLSLVSTP